MIGRKRKRKRRVGWFQSVSTVLLIATSEVQADTSSTKPLISELLIITAKHGWVADMDTLCESLKLPPAADCKFQQMSIGPDAPGSVDKFGINLPLAGSSQGKFVLMFQTNPLVGNFFVVSPEGELKESYFRIKGTGYLATPSDDARRAFDRSLTFWRDNLPALKALVEDDAIPKPKR